MDATLERNVKTESLGYITPEHMALAVMVKYMQIYFPLKIKLTFKLGFANLTYK